MSQHYLEQERDGGSKAFSIDKDMLVGKSMGELYEGQSKYQEANSLYQSCLTYATAYTETMLTRAQVEDSEIFATKGMSKAEMQALMTNNICLPYKKI